MKEVMKEIDNFVNERGWIGIDDGGVIRRGSISATVAPVVSSYIDGIEGELCRAHGPSTSAYFAWHWKNKVVKS